MAITIDYITFEILIPKADTVFVGIDPITGREMRSLDMDDFWKALADIQDDQEDVWASTCFINTPPQDLGSIVLGRSVLIQLPYFVTFEDGMYSVDLINGNNNIITRTTVNGVGVNTSNSAGLIQVDIGGSSVWTEPEKDEVIQYSKKASDNAEQANLKL